MKLALFFTRGVSLKLWVDTGLYDREKLIYEEHLKQGNLTKVYWFTYDNTDKELAQNLKNEGRLHQDIEVLKMPSIFKIPKLGSWFYSFFLPLIYLSKLKECDFLKTNQMDGSWSAVIAKWLCKKPLILRTGYTVTQLWKNTNRSTYKIKIYEFLERFAYLNSDISIVASYHNKKYIKSMYRVKNAVVMPNFIDTNLFKDIKLERYDDRLLFVGRLNQEKNLFNLIEAVSKTTFILDIYGQGELKGELENLANKLGANVNFLGVITNSELPKIYNSYKYYILPSLFEGMPKTLLEAMACGCICIGTDVSGINEVIEDLGNGLLADSIQANDILKTLNKLNEIDYTPITFNAIEKIHNYFSLKSVVVNEKNIFCSLLTNKG